MEQPEPEGLPKELKDSLGELLGIVNNFKIVGEGLSGSLQKGYQLDYNTEGPL